MKKGFTLVELSIVLVVIGLLIGGVLVGQSMIEAAKINKIVKDISQIQIAVRTFKDKYKYLPGDQMGTSPLGCGGATAWKCTGNKNGTIDLYERLQSWYQLSVSKIYQGNFSGRDSDINPYIAGSDVPAVKEIGDNAGYILSSAYTASGHSTASGNPVFPSTPTYANSILIAKGGVNGPALSVEQTIALDNKMDDGSHYTGRAYGAGVAYVCNTSYSYYNWGAGTTLMRNPNACVFYVQFDDF